MTSELFKEWHTWATDRLAQPRSPAAAHSYEYWLELKVGRLATDKAALEQRVEQLKTEGCGQCEACEDFFPLSLLKITDDGVALCPGDWDEVLVATSELAGEEA